MVDFLAIKQVYVPEALLLRTGNWLRKAGTYKEEAFVLWVGIFQTPQDFLVTNAILPEQTCLKSASGVGVYVSGDELFRIGRWLYDNQRVLIAQVHSHPGRAYHSDTDDSFPMVTAVGQFSVVVPNFARAPLADLFGCAIFRLNGNNKWINVDYRMANEVFVVVSDGDC